MMTSSMIIIVIISISIISNIVLSMICSNLYKSKKVSDSKIILYQNMLNQMKEKFKIQEEKNQKRLNKLVVEVAQLKNISINDVWRLF